MVSLQMKDQTKTIVALLLDALYDTKVALESLRGLAVVLPHLKEKDVGCLFKDISMQTAAYLDDVSQQTETLSFLRWGSPKDKVEDFPFHFLGVLEDFNSGQICLQTFPFCVP